MGSYPSANPERIETYQKMAVQALKDYDVRILEKMASPRGIVAQCKFVPSIAEMVEFCEKLANKAWEQDRRDRNREIQLTYRPAEKTGAQKAAERERVKEGFKALLAELDANLSPLAGGGKPRLSKAEEKAHAERWLEMEAERLRAEPLPKLSEELRVKMGLVDQPKAV